MVSSYELLIRLILSNGMDCSSLTPSLSISPYHIVPVYIRGVAGTKKVGGQTIRYFHLSCELKYAEALLYTRSCHLWPKKWGAAAPPAPPFPTPLYIGIAMVYQH